MRPLTVICLIGLMLLLGCDQEPQVYQYIAPRQQIAKTERLLGAITRTSHGTWFFKAQGPAKSLEAQAKAFESLIRSLKFGDTSKPISWTLPEGWADVPADQIPDSQFKPFAMIRFGDKKTPVDLTVTRFGPTQGGDLNQNVTRWRKKIGLHDNRAVDVESSYTQLDMPHGPVYLIDIAGPGQPDTPNAMATRPGNSPHGLIDDKSANAGEKVFEHLKAHLVYSKPGNWTEKENKEAGVLRHFVIRNQGRRAEVLIQAAPLENDAALIAHLNRYAQKLNLPPIDPKNLGRSIRPVTMGGGGPQSGTLLELTPPSAENGLTIVLTNQAGFPTLFHLFGDTVLVKENKPVLIAFCRSFWFHGKEHD